ncbi:hypothetical protein CRI94_08275 [Longibacter salinarum]|uniref:Uncharacterized protein n=1 Tax=Longibacter salinarum TaxID=1850348 RepID=A0A2A8CZ91_9BACT|nr:hypothetical protein [Longibacter salinarum]PEN14032.1 hypothetical protein CRI94_08275 [Longibacter salinarum]
MPLSVELFTGAVHDVERTQYEILGGLKTARDAFSDNRIYPHLGQLVKFYRAITTMLETSEQMRSQRNGTLSGVDWDDMELTYEWPQLDGDDMSVVADLIEWALPYVQDTLNEGKSVFEFVDEQLEVETVGIVPSYLKEGYLMVPDRTDHEFRVFRYTMSIVHDEGEKARMLRTTLCRSVSCEDVEPHPSTIKLELVKERRDLPNPATYFFDSGVPFPYEETMLPVVKRRLLRHLTRETGRA